MQSPTSSPSSVEVPYAPEEEEEQSHHQKGNEGRKKRTKPRKMSPLDQLIKNAQSTLQCLQSKLVAVQLYEENLQDAESRQLVNKLMDLNSKFTNESIQILLELHDRKTGKETSTNQFSTSFQGHDVTNAGTVQDVNRPSTSASGLAAPFAIKDNVTCTSRHRRTENSSASSSSPNIIALLCSGCGRPNCPHRNAPLSSQ